MESKLIHGDCLVEMAKIPDRSIDMVLCDLPFGSTKCKWDIVIPFEKLWEHYNRICKENAAILLFSNEPFASNMRLSNLENYRYDWYWNKKRAANFLFMNRQPGKIIENICVFYRKQPKYNPQKIIRPQGEHKGSRYKNPCKITQNVKDIMGSGWKETQMDGSQNYHGKNYEPDKLLPTSLLEFVKDTRRVHPTQKPVALCEYLIKTYTDDGDTVLDNWCGSGSSLVASKRLGRKFIGIESNQRYYDICVSRINDK